MFEIIAIVCLVNDFGANSSNECFFLQKGNYETRAACNRESDKDKIRLRKKLRDEFGDDYVYVIESVCRDKEGA